MTDELPLFASKSNFPRWIDMAVEQPQHGQRVLFWYDGDWRVGTYTKGRFYVGNKTLLQGSHWMPGPEKP